MKPADYFIPAAFRSDKQVEKLEQRVEELKRSLESAKDDRDQFKGRAHTAEESLRQAERRYQSDPIRCAHVLKKVLGSLPPELSQFEDAFRNVSSLIDIEDDMIWSSTPEQYFQVGIDAMRVIASACDKYLDRKPARILDLPCGHGRVMRWLKFAYPDASLAGCDTQEHGVSFCESQFGSTPVKATEKPSDLTSENRYDVIWIGSLFTHLPEAEFIDFLKHLPNLLTAGGIVIFTTHGEEAMKRLRDGGDFHLHQFDREAIEKNYTEKGFDFMPYKRTPDYGVSFNSSQFLTNRIKECPNFESLSLAEDTWVSLQDVCICQRTD